jgi:hypothetical protein
MYKDVHDNYKSYDERIGNSKFCKIGYKSSK